MAARGRVLLSTGAVILVSLLPGVSSHEALLYVLGLFWVPWSAFIALVADSRSPRVTRLCGAAGDLLVLLAVGALLPGSGAIVRMGGLIVVLLGAYSGGWREGVGLSVAALGTLVGSARLAPGADTGVGIVLLFAGAMALILLVVARVNSEQGRAILRWDRLVGRSAAILEHVADGVIVTDSHGRILEANPGAERIMSCGQSDAVGRACGSVLALGVGERRLACTDGCDLLAIGEGDREQGCEVWWASEDGRRHPLLASVSAITDADGRVEEVVHSLRDITRLKQADEAKTMFLATASHELKTPLTVIRGFAEVLQQRPDLAEGARTEAANAIVRRSQELSEIVDRLLLSSRIEAGRLELEVREVEVAPIVEEVGRSLEAATGRPVDVFVEKDLPTAVADPAAVTAVVEQLLDNAVKYSPGAGTVALSAHATDEHVEIRVADQGIGMDDEQAARCFDKFWQAESTDVRRFKGTGIGLYIVRSMTDAMGGTVTVATSTGRGAMFTVRLRRADIERPDRGTPLAPGVGEESIVREFMRQMGVPEGAHT